MFKPFLSHCIIEKLQDWNKFFSTEEPKGTKPLFVCPNPGIELYNIQQKTNSLIARPLSESFNYVHVNELRLFWTKALPLYSVY